MQVKFSNSKSIELFGADLQEEQAQPVMNDQSFVDQQKFICLDMLVGTGPEIANEHHLLIDDPRLAIDSDRQP